MNTEEKINERRKDREAEIKKHKEAIEALEQRLRNYDEFLENLPFARGGEMNLKEMSDEELVRGLVVKSKVMPYFTDEENEIQDILSRLARGRKAIEALEKFSNLLNDLKSLNYIINNLYYSPGNRYFMIAEATIYAYREASKLIKNRMKYNGRETTDEN